MKQNGTLLSQEEFKLSDSHGQFRFNHRHPHIPAGAEEELLFNAFKQDFQVNGPSLFRLIRTTLAGWKRYQSSSDKRVRDRYLEEVEALRNMYAGAIWAMKKWYRQETELHQQLDDLLQDIYHTLGLQPRLMAPLAGRYIYWAMKREHKRMLDGSTIEPETFFEKNKAAMAETKDTKKSMVESTPIQDLAGLKPQKLVTSGLDRG